MIKVLVVDDSALARKLLGRVLATDAEFSVAFAKSGAEALEMVNTFEPNVITLDVNMPDMDGLACLDRIMVESPRPVVMVSSVTAAGAETTLEAMRLGAVDVIAKPSGAVSLGIDDMSADLLAKVRSAASARVSTLRLKDRISNRGTVDRTARARTKTIDTVKGPTPRSAEGEGLVLIGVSTGGPPALEKILEVLDADFGWPIVIAQHMPATFTGALARRLDKLCALKVSEVTKPTDLEPGNVYVARGDGDIVISARRGQLVASPAIPLPGYLWRPSVDRLVRTAMEAAEAHQLTGVMLTGMGNDGSQAMTDLKAAGGRTIAESEDSAVIWGMPGELVKMGGAEWTAPASAIGGLLNSLAPSCR